MCKCTPEIRTPFCGKPGCEWPEQRSAPSGPNVGGILQSLYDSEINATISWFWDGGFNLLIGDQYNGVKFAGNVDTIDEAACWFVEHAKRLYPKSKFSRDHA